jgi:hypothetical protein
MLTIAKDTTIQADPAAVWRAWRPSFPMRPPEEEALNLHLYDLAYGLKVPVTLVAVEDMRRWTVEHALPGGRLVIDHWMEPAGSRRVRVGKRYEVHGPMSIVYRLLFARRIRRSVPEQLAVLEREANRPA